MEVRTPGETGITEGDCINVTVTLTRLNLKTPSATQGMVYSYRNPSVQPEKWLVFAG